MRAFDVGRQMAELYQELLTDFFQGVFQEVRFVIPASLPGVLGAFQAAFGVRGSPSRAQPFSVMGASITSVNSSTSKFSFSRTKQTDSF